MAAILHRATVSLGSGGGHFWFPCGLIFGSLVLNHSLLQFTLKKALGDDYPI